MTNHAAVFLLIADNPDIRIDSLSRAAGISRRTSQMIVADLCRAGYLKRSRRARRNHYSIDPSLPLRHHALRQRATTAALLAMLQGEPAA